MTKEKLFEAIYKECDDLQDCYNTLKEAGMKEDYCKGVTYEHIHLQHLLRTAEARGKKIVIDVWGNVMEIIGENEHGINLNTPICRVNLTKSVEEQEEATLIQLAKVIL